MWPRTAALVGEVVDGSQLRCLRGVMVGSSYLSIALWYVPISKNGSAFPSAIETRATRDTARSLAGRSKVSLLTAAAYRRLIWKL